MSTITEQTIWENSIYLIDENDPVQGGTTGISNKAPKQLANRTAYLKAQQESTAKKLNNTIGGADDEVTLASLLEQIQGLQTEFNNRKLPYIPVGWILDTTVHYTSAVDVAKAMGYGTWQRFGEGCVSVGYSTDSDDPDWTHNMGEEFGEYEHTLTVNEMPKLTGEFQTLQANSYISTGIFTTQNQSSNANIGGANEAWAHETISIDIGNDNAHNNVQRSIVVGRWVRIA